MGIAVRFTAARMSTPIVRIFGTEKPLDRENMQGDGKKLLYFGDFWQ
ncbi:hypothetical protein [Microcystis aeruginosa]|nr:hypothetical protein [Microcystis aeruginosa]